MQLPGWRSEPVRVSLDITWWPSDDMFSCSSRLWVREDASGTWQMEAMEASALWTRFELDERVTGWATNWADYLKEIAAEDADVKGRPW